jgi:hypothetical protein
MDMTINPNYYLNDKYYKSKYICTDCRKSFKRKILSDISNNKEQTETESKCPECGNLTNWIGPKFRAPKMDNINAWNSIKIMKEIGILDFIGWSTNHIEIPETKKSLNTFLIELKANYEIHIKKWTSAKYTPENKNQIKYFSDAVIKLEKYLKLK